MSSKHEALEVAAGEMRAAQRQDRDELLAAQRVLRRAERARDPEGVDEARRLLRRLTAVVEDGERVVDMAPAVAAGHDGIVVATDRRVLFLALRRALIAPYRRITGVAVKGRRFRARLVVSTADATMVIGGLRPARAAAIETAIRDGRERGLSSDRPVSSNPLNMPGGGR